MGKIVLTKIRIQYMTTFVPKMSLTLVLKVKVAAIERTTPISIVADIKSKSCNFSSVSFVHVSCSANEVAHVLARWNELNAYSVFSNN